MPNVQRFSINAVGRDYVVGDVHGCFDQVIESMKAVRFDRSRDRLFCVGDTVDRGPGSPRALAFLRQPWVHAVRGNHEDMFLDLYQKDNPHPFAVEYATGSNGMGWWRDLPEDARREMIAEFRKLPVVIEIETARGKVGLVHADVPSLMDWQTFVAKVEADDKDVIQQAIWGRSRVSRGDESGVRGIDRIFVGHTPQKVANRLGNVYYIDTGAVFGVMNNDPAKGRMTIASLSAKTCEFKRDPETGKFVEVRAEEPDVVTPFGRYAT